MSDLDALLKRLETLANKSTKANLGETSPEEIRDKLMLPAPPLKPSNTKLFPTREEAQKRDTDREYDEAMTEAEQVAEQIKKWLVG